MGQSKIFQRSLVQRAFDVQILGKVDKNLIKRCLKKYWFSISSWVLEPSSGTAQQTWDCHEIELRADCLQPVQQSSSDCLWSPVLFGLLEDFLLVLVGELVWSEPISLRSSWISSSALSERALQTSSRVLAASFCVMHASPRPRKGDLDRLAAHKTVPVLE